MSNLIYVILYIRSDICFSIGMVSRYQSNLSPQHWTTIQHTQVSNENEGLYVGGQKIELNTPG